MLRWFIIGLIQLPRSTTYNMPRAENKLKQIKRLRDKESDWK